MLKVVKKDYKEIDIYCIGYVTFKEIANCDNVNNVNSLYLMINEMFGHFEEKIKIIFSFEWCEWKQKSFKEIWRSFGSVKKEIETINRDKKIEYGKN